MDLNSIISMVEIDLKMELGQFSTQVEALPMMTTHFWSPPPRGCLKVNMDATYKDNVLLLLCWLVMRVEV